MKSMEYDYFIKVLWNLLFDQHIVKLHNGFERKIPSLYKFCFEIFDIGDKEFICEHDLFQLINKLE